RQQPPRTGSDSSSSSSNAMELDDEADEDRLPLPPSRSAAAVGRSSISSSASSAEGRLLAEDFVPSSARGHHDQQQQLQRGNISIRSSREDSAGLGGYGSLDEDGDSRMLAVDESNPSSSS